MSTLRCFIGLPVAQPARRALEQCSAMIRQHDEMWAGQKWVPPENLHLTIVFLGELESVLIPDISAAMSRWASDLGGLTLGFTALEAVPRTSRASMIWARMTDDGSSARLAAAAGEWLGAHEMTRDLRPFVPHVTLARSRRPMHSPECLGDVFASAGLESVVVSDPPITLFSSRLTAAGPVYETLASSGVNRTR